MNQKKSCCIFGAGDLYVKQVCIPSDALVIAADGGLYHLRTLGIRPDVFLGDFDSADKADAGENCVVFPSEKDYTDMFLAVEYGVKAGCTEFDLYGALGGTRFEHTYANLQLLEHFAAQGHILRLHGDGEIITAVSQPSSSAQDKTIYFDESHRGYLSLFAMGGEVRGVTLKGLKYPLDKQTLRTDFPLGVSNEFCGVPSEIRFTSGTLLMIWQE